MAEDIPLKTKNNNPAAEELGITSYVEVSE